VVANIVHLAGGHSLLQDQGYGPDVAGGLRFVDTLLLGDPPVEPASAKSSRPPYPRSGFARSSGN
jgi:hypothetical protein